MPGHPCGELDLRRAGLQPAQPGCEQQRDRLGENRQLDDDPGHYEAAITPAPLGAGRSAIVVRAEFIIRAGQGRMRG
jgi:hypothetical protein